MKLNPGDLVFIVADASHIIREKNITTKAVVMREIPGDWYRVYMSWGNKTKTVDLPKHMLRKIEK